MTEKTARTGTRPVFHLREVRKVREKGGVKFELRIPSFIIGQGEFIAVVGPSGCGKSTLLDMLALVLKPTTATHFSFRTDKGEMAEVGGLPERKLASVRRRNIGYVLQTGGLLPFLSVRQNILLPCRLNNRKCRESVQALARRLGIEDQLSKKPQHLSGGQRQRVAIARALAHKPPFILADEPTAAVDRPTALEIRNKFKELTQKMGATLIMVTHDRALAREGVDRVFTFRLAKAGPNHTVSTLVELRKKVQQ